MDALRRRLRVSVMAWMVFQVVSLAALVPRDCCQSHQTAAARPAGNCHEAPDAAYCPMRSQGRVCPMHQARQASAEADHSQHGAAEHEGQPAAHDHEQAPADDCRLGGVCNVPAAALAAILSNHGLVPGRLLMPANAGLAAAALVPDERLVGCLIPPDNPPPRA